MTTLKPSLVACAALLVALAAPVRAADQASHARPAPAWVAQGTGAFESKGKGKVLRGVGIAGHKPGAEASEPLGWVALFRALSELSQVMSAEEAALAQQAPAPVSAAVAAATGGEPGSRTFNSTSFGCVRVQHLGKVMEEPGTDGGTERTVTSSLTVACEEDGHTSLFYKDYQTAKSGVGALEEEQAISLVLAEFKGTEALLAEVQGAGVRLAGLWTAPDGVVYAMVELDLAGLKKRIGARDQRPGPDAGKKPGKDR